MSNNDTTSSRSDQPQLSMLQLGRCDSVEASRPTTGLTLHRTLEIHFPMLSRFMFEAELYPLLTLSRAINAQIRKEIAHAQSQERFTWHRMRVEIEEQLACIKQIRSHVTESEQKELDDEATRSCTELLSARDFHRPIPPLCRSLIERGGRVLTPDDELDTNLSEMVREILQQVETKERTNSLGPQFCPPLVEFLKLCFLSNPLLWRNKQSVGNGGYTILELMLETMLSRFTFDWGPRIGLQMDAVRATADLLTWLIQLLLLQPPLFSSDWCYMDQHLLDMCAKEIASPVCITSEKMLVTPRNAHEIAQLKQLRWSIIRQCAGGSSAHSFSSANLRLNAPLSLPSFHPHQMVYFRGQEDQPAACVCPACELSSEESDLANHVWMCDQCNFRMHRDCVLRTCEAQECGFRARTADEVWRMLRTASPAPLPVESIPRDLVHDLVYTFARVIDSLWSVEAIGLFDLMLESSRSVLVSLQDALKSGKLPRKRYNSGVKSPLQSWLNGWMKDATDKRRLLALLTGPSKLRSLLLLLDESNDQSSTQALMDSSVEHGNSSSSSVASLRVDPFPFPFRLFFDLVRRKERRLLSDWLKRDRAFFVAIWPQLVHPATGCPPLLYLVAHVRGCRQHVFTLLARFTCDALRLKPADLLLQRNAAGQSLAELLDRDHNRDLRGVIDVLSTGASEDN